MSDNHPDWTKFMQAYATMAQSEWKEKYQAVMQMIQSDRKSRCYGQGEEKKNSNTMEIYSGYVGNVFISAKNLTRPQIADESGKPIDPDNTLLYRKLTSAMYAGCRVNALVSPWLQVANREKGYGNGVRCDLVALQFFEDDAPFGEAAPDISKFFGPVAGTSGNAAPAAPAMGLPPFMMGK
jgi:hypothetical protein